MRSPDPTGQPIRNIARVAMRGNPILQPPTGSHTPTVINPRGAIKVRVVALPALVDALRQAIAVARAARAVVDHLADGGRRARVLHRAAVVARRGAVVVLHQAWVAHAVVGGRGADAAAGLLHQDGEDEAVVDAGLLGDGLDAVVDGADFGAAVVGDAELAAGLEHEVFVVVEPRRWL